jgi:hypothetical protein
MTYKTSARISELYPLLEYTSNLSLVIKYTWHELDHPSLLIAKPGPIYTDLKAQKLQVIHNRFLRMTGKYSGTTMLTSCMHIYQFLNWMGASSF